VSPQRNCSNVQIAPHAMTYTKFNAFCRGLPATTYVVQWGGSHVWKVGGKVFAIGGWQDDEPSSPSRGEAKALSLRF
jgi:predicted DNA-binding protein (MmcQ/YjbR family)